MSVSQLSAVGIENAPLNKNPQLTLFKTGTKRITHFVEEPKVVQFTGSVQAGSIAKVQIDDQGDLLRQAYIAITWPAIEFDYSSKNCESYTEGRAYWVNSRGHAAIENLDFKVGNNVVDTHTGLFLEMWNELTAKPFNEGWALIGKYHSIDDAIHQSSKCTTTYTPLKFFWNNTAGQAYLAIAMEFHTVELSLKLTSMCHLWISQGKVIYTADPENPDAAGCADLETWQQTTNAPIKKDCGDCLRSTDICVWLELKVTFLSKFERQQIVDKSHVYTVRLVKTPLEKCYPSSAGCENTVDLDLRLEHPVTELIWVIRPDVNICEKRFYDFSFDGESPYQEAQMFMGSTARFSPAKNHTYFDQIVPYECHTRTPDKHVSVFSFAIAPESTQPTGACNFTRISNAKLVLKLTAGMGKSTITLFAPYLNQFVYYRGLAGVSFA